VMYVLPESWIKKLLDATVKGTVVMVIGLTLTARVGVKLWTGDGGGVDLTIGFICVVLMARISKTKRSVTIQGVKIYLKSISLLMSIVIGWILYKVMHSSSKLIVALDDAESGAPTLNCSTPNPGYGKEGYGYDFSDVSSKARLDIDGFYVVGLQCAPGRPDGIPFSGPTDDCVCPSGQAPCACPCTAPGEPYIVSGCGLDTSTTFWDFPGANPFVPGPQGETVWVSLLIPWFITRIAATLESVGDVTATAKYSGKRVDGKHFDQRLRGALNMDALSGCIASLFGGWPLTTMSQNNGLIKMSGLHDWRGGLVAGTMMMVLSPFAEAFNPPMPVMGGCLTVIYATIAMGGISMLTEVSEADKAAYKAGRKASLELPVDKPRTVFIVAASVGLGLGAEMHAYGLNNHHTLGYKILKDTDDPLFQTLAIIFESGIATATLMALVLSVVWPDSMGTVIKTAFVKFDQDGSGTIDAAELKLAIRHMGLHLGDAEISRMMATADKDGDGEISYKEFEAMIKSTAEGAEDWELLRAQMGVADPEAVTAAMQQVQSAFEQMDQDGSGKIDKAELKLALQHMGGPMSTLSEQELTDMMDAGDKDGDGEIDFAEFADMMQGTAQGATAWAHMRQQQQEKQQQPTESSLGLDGVRACVEVHSWLTERLGLAGSSAARTADTILRGFVEAGYRRPQEWLQELQAMSTEELDELAGRRGSGGAAGVGGAGAAGPRDSQQQQKQAQMEDV
jgi:xanthine/uracil permease/Ca2+-binding EF-hand superfamily protein